MRMSPYKALWYYGIVTGSVIYRSMMFCLTDAIAWSDGICNTPRLHKLIFFLFTTLEKNFVDRVYSNKS